MDKNFTFGGGGEISIDPKKNFKLRGSEKRG
jgi:hypothetical protein